MQEVTTSYDVHPPEGSNPGPLYMKIKQAGVTLGEGYE